MSGLSLRPRPFALPEYGYAVAKFVHEGVSRLMEAKDEVWARIPRAEPSETIPVTQNTMPSGEVVESNPIMTQAKFVLSYDDIRACNGDALALQMDSAAEESLAVVMPRFFDLLGRTSEAAGTATDLGGKPFTFDVYLATIEKTDMAFDEKGNPEWPTLIVHPDFAKYLSSLPPPTAEQQKRLDDLIERKRREYHARRRHRNLC